MTDGGGADEARGNQTWIKAARKQREATQSNHFASCDLRVNVTFILIHSTTVSNVHDHHAPVVAQVRLGSRHQSAARTPPPRTQT